MIRLNLVLLVAVIASAMYLVHNQYESRRLFVELERAAAEARRIDIDNDRLEVQRRAQATPLRVEKIAKEQLQMRTTTPAITQYVTYADASAAVTQASKAAAATRQVRQPASSAGVAP